jgi:hypothetical protein
MYYVFPIPENTRPKSMGKQLKYPTEEYGQAAVWTRAKQTIATFMIDYQQHCKRVTHPVQELKKQIKVAYSDASTLLPSQQRIDKIKALENKLQKTLYAQSKSATAAANKAAYNEGQSKQFYKKYRPSLKTGGLSSLHTTPDWDDPETKKEPSSKVDDMGEEEANYYIWLFQERQAQNPEPILEKLRERKLNEINKEYLDKKISKAECRQAIRSMADDISGTGQTTGRILQAL